MARPCKIPKDPKLYDELLEHLALGLPQVLIAQAIDVPEQTLSNWKRRKDFGRDLALKKLEILGDPLRKVRKSNPLAYIERHPDTRDDFKPPVLQQKLDANILTNVKDLTDDELTAVIQSGGGTGTSKPETGEE